MYLAQVHFLDRPEAGLRLFVHVPQLWVLDRKQHEPGRVRPTDGLHERYPPRASLLRCLYCRPHTNPPSPPQRGLVVSRNIRGLARSRRNRRTLRRRPLHIRDNPAAFSSRRGSGRFRSCRFRCKRRQRLQVSFRGGGGGGASGSSIVRVSPCQLSRFDLLRRSVPCPAAWPRLRLAWPLPFRPTVCRLSWSEGLCGGRPRIRNAAFAVAIIGYGGWWGSRRRACSPHLVRMYVD